jgi:hypothetical protein
MSDLDVMAVHATVHGAGPAFAVCFMWETVPNSKYWNSASVINVLPPLRSARKLERERALEFLHELWSFRRERPVTLAFMVRGCAGFPS